MEQLIQNMIDYIEKTFRNDCSGHDYFHTLRVYRTAVKLAEQEGADPLTVALAALLHDADDFKLSPETYPDKDNARRLMRENAVAEETAEAVIRIIEQVSFAGTDSVTPDTIEGRCVQDADRLDALGAIGIARAFAYGGSHQRLMYDPDEKPSYGMTKEEYQKHVSSSVNHFYEKLFLLKDMMTTASGKRAAEDRERFMKDYLDEFYREWDGKDIG